MTTPLRIPMAGALCAVCVVALGVLAAGPGPAFAQSALQNAQNSLKRDPATLIDKVRRATARFRDINVAIAEGWVPATPCVSGPDTGAMGVHFVLAARLGDGVVKAEKPEALIYEPLPDGEMRLVGV